MKQLLKKALCLGVALTGLVGQLKADKGMWLLNELTKENIAKMQELGFKLSPEQLYSLDKPSVASSVIIFGGGCTGVTVSNTGLVMTNHHCGFDAIQQSSTVDHDYLRDGFVSQSHREELPIPGLEVRYLANIQDVTAQLLAKVKKAKTETQRTEMLQAALLALRAEAEKKAAPNQEVVITPFYAGNKYYMLTYNVFKDVRMVFAPPMSIGKFGGETDNWMWPRHTGDFAVFRVYADKDNKPAAYSKDNVPYTPKYFAEVSTQGIKEGDYAMTIGFPGRTSRYIPSWGVESRMVNENDPRAEVRGAKQASWRKFMNEDQSVRIKYDSKYARSSNYWKNSIEMNKALRKNNVVGSKQQEEAAFAKWVQAHKNKEYRTVLEDLRTAYQASGELTRRLTYLSETFSGSEVLGAAAVLAATQLSVNSKEEVIAMLRSEFYKDYAPKVDQATMPILLDILRKHLAADEVATIYADIDSKFGGNTKAFVDDLFAKSFVPYEDKVVAAVKDGTLIAKIGNDPAHVFGEKMRSVLKKLQGDRAASMTAINKGNRLYFAARKEMNPSEPMPSDANFTMRMSYGTVKGYKPADGITYSYYTTTNGILEKNKIDNPEYVLKPEYRTMLEQGQFGRWADAKTGKLQVAFLSNNDITGGNSGSPVFDANGRVIGLAFDGNSEAMSGDIEFEHELQRTISVDIRYVLYVIEQWGKCPRLIEELRLR
ncbi:MAG: S46 family peptidase [Porphyromonas sp.]|nr:S46 family peptidase [Porphyromonas sp.]